MCKVLSRKGACMGCSSVAFFGLSSDRLFIPYGNSFISGLANFPQCSHVFLFETEHGKTLLWGILKTTVQIVVAME